MSVERWEPHITKEDTDRAWLSLQLADDAGREKILRYLLNAADRSSRCWFQDHEGRIEAVAAQMNESKSEGAQIALRHAADLFDHGAEDDPKQEIKYLRKFADELSDGRVL